MELPNKTIVLFYKDVKDTQEQLVLLNNILNEIKNGRCKALVFMVNLPIYTNVLHSYIANQKVNLKINLKLDKTKLPKPHENLGRSLKTHSKIIENRGKTKIELKPQLTIGKALENLTNARKTNSKTSVNQNKSSVILRLKTILCKPTENLGKTFNSSLKTSLKSTENHFKNKGGLK